MTENPDGTRTLDVTVPILLRQTAIDTPVGTLAENVLKMRSSSAGDRSAINSTIMVEIAAEHRPPAEIAELVAEFVDQSTAEDLARLALDAAAARRSPQTMALLAHGLVEYGLQARAAELLAIVVRRRLPRDIAELLTTLDANGQVVLTGTLIAEIATDDGRVFVMLWLRALHRADLATRLAEQMAAMLDPAALAGFVKGLRAFQDTDAADAAVRGALGLSDLGLMANLIENLHAGAEERPADPAGTPDRTEHAEDFIRQALDRLPLADLCVLAGRLSAGPWREGAQLIWEAVVPGVTGADLVHTLSESVQLYGNPGAALDGLSKAALIYSVQDVAVLAVEVEGKIAVLDDERHSGYDTVLNTVAEGRPVPDIFAMADELNDRGYGRVAADLLGRVESVVHRRTDGTEIAEFIDWMLARQDRPQPRGPFRRAQPWRPATIVRNVAAAGKPDQLMGVIAGLAQRRRYNECRSWFERTVPEHFGGPRLAQLPLVLRRDQLPAVLQILVKGCRTPNFTGPGDVAAIAVALREAGATDTDRCQLFLYTGGVRDLDYREIVTALKKTSLPREYDPKVPEEQRLPKEAHWILNGRRSRPGEPEYLG